MQPIKQPRALMWLPAGKMLAQSAAIERYAANLAGLIPKDPWAEAKVRKAVTDPKAAA